jgi:dienelactone hydrolase
MEIVLASQRVAFEEAVPFVVTGVAPGSPCSVEVRCTIDDKSLVSSAVFEADDVGTVDPRRSAAVRGSYLGLDGRGLYWSADPVDGWPARPGLGDVQVGVVASSGAQAVATAEFVRYRLDPRTLCSKGDDATTQLFLPPGDGLVPGVVVFGGSEGGRASADLMAAALSRHGLACLSVAYFGMPGLPPFHQEVPIDRIHTCIDSFACHPRVLPGGVAVHGTSRGGELALLLGATSAAVLRVVANVPSGVVWSGMDATGATIGSAWSLNGRPVPWLQRRTDTDITRAALARDVLELTPLFEFDLSASGGRTIEEATIPVERTNGPILLLSGKADAVWPSTTLANIAVNRARDREFAFPIEHIAYDGAGHFCVRLPGSAAPTQAHHPVIGKPVSVGGTRDANAAAAADAWPRIVRFLGGH